jgi:hypothetical protein
MVLYFSQSNIGSQTGNFELNISSLLQTLSINDEATINTTTIYLSKVLSFSSFPTIL